jgi:hypothetical protein
MFSDIAERGGAEERVHDGVQQHIRIGVTEETEGVRDFHAAEDQGAALY